MFTIIVQGPIHHHSLEIIEYYQSIGPVIISCWETDNWQNIRQSDKVKVVFSHEYDILGYNSHNIYRQCITTLKGLYNTKTEYVIKVRSDEKYSNLDPIISKVLESPEKFITNNVFFKKVNEPLHPSDHVIAGRSLKLFTGFHLLKFLLDKNTTFNYKHLPSNIFGLFPFSLMNESLIFGAWLLANHPDALTILNKEDETALYNTMVEFTDVVPIDEMGEFIWSMNTDKGRVFHNTSDALYNCNLPSIKEMTNLICKK